MKLRISHLIIVSLIGVLSMPTAIAGSMITSTLDDLVSENNNQVLGDSQERLLSVMGLSPDADVGLSMWYRHDKSTTSSVLSGQYMLNPDSRDNYILRHTFPLCENFTPSTITDIASDLDTLQLESGKRLALRLNLLDPALDAEKRALINTAIMESDSLDVAAKRTIQEKIRTCPNIMIISWSSENNDKATSDFSSFFKGKASKSKKTSGYAVIAGLRSNYVMYGSDYKEKMKTQKRGEYYYTVTSSLQAQAISYVSGESFQRSFLANLNIPLDDVSKYLSTIKKLGIDISLNQSGERLNFGSLGQSKWLIEKASTTTTDLADLKRFIETSDDQKYSWKTIYSVRTKRCDTGNWFQDDHACQTKPAAP